MNQDLKHDLRLMAKWATSPIFLIFVLLTLILMVVGLIFHILGFKYFSEFPGFDFILDFSNWWENLPN